MGFSQQLCHQGPFDYRLFRTKDWIPRVETALTARTRGAGARKAFLLLALTSLLARASV